MFFEFNMISMRSKAFNSILYLLVAISIISLSSCGSMAALKERHERLNIIIPQLELGMPQDELRSRVPFEPDFSAKELLKNDVVREMFTYRGTIVKKWPQRDIPIFYHLVFEDGILVAVESEEDVEEVRRRTFISTSFGFTF